jgi:hypothetical protein
MLVILCILFEVTTALCGLDLGSDLSAVRVKCVYYKRFIIVLLALESLLFQVHQVQRRTAS